MTLDGLSLEFPPHWTVGRFERLILARNRDSRIGSLQITVAYRSAVRGDAGHEECQGILASYASSPNFSRLGEPEVEEPEEGDDIDALDAADEAAGAAQDAADPVT